MKNLQAIELLRGIKHCNYRFSDAELEALDKAISVLEIGRNLSKTGFLCSECSFGDFDGFHGYKPRYCPNCGVKIKYD